MKKLNLSLIPFCLTFAFSFLIWAQNSGTNSPPNLSPAVQTNSTPDMATNRTASSPLAATNSALSTQTNSALSKEESGIRKETTPGATVEADPEGRNIRFQFDGIPYSDVIQRFCQMANKPLLSDTKVEGTLTFNDPKPYTYPEAMEMLNLVLSMKGVMLVESDRYLKLAPLKELPQLPLRIFRGLERTGDVRPGEVVTVVLSLQNLESTDIAQAVTSMLSNAGSIAPLSRGRGMIITDRLANIKRIQNLLAEIDTASPVQRQMKTYTLINSSGVVLSDLINKTFGIATAPKRVEFNQQSKVYQQLPADPSDYVTAIFDEASRTLVLYGPGDRLLLAENLIKRFEDQKGARASEIKIFYPQSTSAQELARMIRQAIPSVASENDPPAAVATKARLIVDAATNRLIVTAPVAGQLDDIEALVKRIDVPSEGGPGSARFQEVQVTKIIRCKVADPDTIIRILTDAYARPNMRGRMVSSLKITLDPKTKNLVLMGTPGEVENALQVIAQLDSEKPVKRVLRILTLKSGRATEFAPRIRQIYIEQIKSQPELGSADAFFVGEDVSNRLFFTAVESQTKFIEDLVNQLDTPAEGTTRELKTIALKHTSANGIATMLSQFYSRQVRIDDPSRRVTVTASPDDQAIVVEATTATLARIEEVVRTLDVEPSRGTFEVRTYQLGKGANATDISQTLARLFEERVDRRQREPDTRMRARFEADSTANLLMVAATREQFVQIEQTIKNLSATFEVATDIRTFKLQYSKADQMAQVLESVLGEEGAAMRRNYPWYYNQRSTSTDSKKLRITAAPTLNAVVIQGPPDKLSVAEQLLKSLDKPETDSASTIQTVRLKKAQADTLADAVNRAMASRGSPSRPRRVTVTPISASNSLLIDGPADEVKEAVQIIQDLDQESASGEIQLRIFKLENGKAREVSRVLNQILDGMPRRYTRSGRTAPESQVTITADERSNSLVISAASDSFKWIEKILTSIDQTPQKPNRVVNFYALNNADAFEIAFRIESMFSDRPRDDRVVVDADIASNTITVVSKKADLPEIEDLIKKLDDAAISTNFQVRMVPLDKVPAPKMAAMLQDVYSQMSRGELKVVDKIPPRPKETNAPASNKLPNTSTNAANENVSAPEKDTTMSPAAKEKTTGEHAPQVIVAVETSANALIISGPARELDHIQSLIYELSQSASGNEEDYRQYQLQEADPVAVARTLNELFRPEPGRIIPGFFAGGGRRGQRQGQPMQPQPQPGQNQPAAIPKIVVVAEPRTRNVIIRAKPTEFALLESLIKQLDVAGVSSQLAFRLVPLANSTAEKMLPLINQMIAQMSLVRPGEPVNVLKDPRGAALFVVARTALLDQVEAMIKQLDTPGNYAEAEVLILPLKNSRAPQLASILQEMLRPGTRGEVTPEARDLQEQVRRLKVQNDKGDAILLNLAKPIKILADPIQGGPGGANRLILASTPDNLKALAAVVAMMDTVPLMEGVSAKLVPLKHADATTVAQTLTSIFQQGQRFAGGGGGGGQGPGGRGGGGFNNPLNVSVDRRGNTLVLSGQPESLKLAQTLIDQLDHEIDSTVTEVKLFRLKYASATRLAPMLQSVFTEGRASAGADGLRIQVSRLQTLLGKKPPKTTEQAQSHPSVLIQADDVTNTLLIAARNDIMPLIEDVINTMDIPAASGLATIRIYPLQHADATTIQRLISNLYQGPNSAQVRKEDKPNIAIDDRTNALIVSGNDNAFAIIASLLEKLDKELPLELRDIHIVPLENADALTVAASLQRLLDARLQQRTSLGKQEANAMRVVVIGDPRTNCLLVGGSNDSFELVRTLAAELDKINPALGGQIRLVPLKHATAQALSTALMTLFSQRYQAARSPDAQRNRPIIIPDPRSNSLMVAANVEDNKVLDALLEKLDREPENPAVVLTVIPLQHNDSTRVATMLANVFLARRQSITAPGVPPAPQDQVHIEADPLTNALIVSANPENLELLKGLLKSIDVEPMAAEGVIQVFTLKKADAQRAASMLRSLVDQGLYRPGTMGTGGRRSTRDTLAVTVDQTSNTLIISASPENLLVVKELIKQIDSQARADAGDIQLFLLKHARASQLATVLEQFFRSKRANEAVSAGGDKSVPVTVTADDRTNTLLVTGGKETFAAIERMIAQLDAVDIMAKTSFQVFPLKQATAAKLQATLTQLFMRRPSTIRGQPPEPITVVADSWANALVIGAAPEDLAMVESLIKQLDSDQLEAGVEVQVMPLAKGDARKVSLTIQALYRSGGAGGSSPVTINVDERMNALVVSAGLSDIKRISELVKKLDTDQVANVSEIRVFPLTNARAVQLAAILTAILNGKPTALTDQSPSRQSLIQFIARTDEGKELLASALREGVLITPDPRTNALIISAPVDYMRLLEQLINRLDMDSPQVAKIKVFNLKNADARQMMTVLSSLFRLQQVAGQQANSRTIRYTLVKPEPSNDPAAESADEEIASATVGTAEENALTVTVDLRTNSLLLGGAEHYVGLAAQIIETLDSSPAQERQAEVYRLKNSRALEIQTALQTFLRQDVQLLSAAVGQAAMAQEILDRQVAIVAETNSNTLLLSASPRYFVQVKDIIEQLDQPQKQVLIQVLLAEVTLDATDELGVEWTYSSKGNPTTKTGTDFGLPAALQNFGGFSSAVSGSSYNFLIRALQSEGRLQVLSRPQILTADNQEANINIGQQVPFVTDSRVTPQGDSINSFGYKSVGVELKVTPRISPDGFVKMDVSPRISSLSSAQVQVSKGFNVPVMNERSATTTVSVQSGQTIIIGGLISTSDDARVKRVPLLGKIPLLGALFRSSTKVQNRQELLIFLTPQVLVKAEELGTTRGAKAVTREQLDKSSIQKQFNNEPLQKQILDPLFSNPPKDSAPEKNSSDVKTTIK